MTWFIILMFWTTSDVPHFAPGWEPVQVQEWECNRAGNALIPYAMERIEQLGGRYRIGCFGASSPEEMAAMMVKHFEIKKGQPL